MANKTITLAQVCEFINTNSKNAEVLREVRDLCKAHLKEEYAVLREKRKEESAASLEAWKAEQEAKPMAYEVMDGKNGKRWLVIVDCYKHKEAIKKAFPKAWFCNSRKGFAVDSSMENEVKAFIKKRNAV